MQTCSSPTGTDRPSPPAARRLHRRATRRIVWEGEVDGGRHSCTFEERPGPAPPGPRDPVPWLCLTATQLRIIGDPIEND